MDNFDLKKFLVENRLTRNSKLLKEAEEGEMPSGFKLLLVAHTRGDVDISGVVNIQGSTMEQAIKVCERMFKEEAQEFWSVKPVSDTETWIGISDETTGLLVAPGSQFHKPEEEWGDEEWDALGASLDSLDY